MDYESYILFSAIALVATITPGPAIMLVSANSAGYGVRKAIYTILGNITGLFCMSLLAVLGLSTIILCSGPIFFTLKSIGALYLIYLGLKLWRHGFGAAKDSHSQTTRTVDIPSSFKLYMQGVFLSLSNPKAIAFTTALFPQFIQPERPLAPQFISLVAIFMFCSFSCLLGYGILAAKAKQHITQNAKNTKNTKNLKIAKKSSSKRLLSRAFGSVFIGSGIALAFTKQQ